MDIYETLKNDHDQLKELLDELISLRENDDYRYVVIEEIRNFFIPHARAKESIFYNTLRAIHADRVKILDGYREHMEVEAILRTLQVMDRMNLEWKGVAKKLKDVLFHHIQEEESEIFNEARKTFTHEEALAIGDAFEQLKPKIQEEGFIKTTFDMVVNLMPPRLSDKLRSFSGKESRP